jgi:hypothetical protein
MALLRSVAVLLSLGIRLSHQITALASFDGAGAVLFLERLAQAAGFATCIPGRELT